MQCLSISSVGTQPMEASRNCDAMEKGCAEMVLSCQDLVDDEEQDDGGGEVG